MSFYCIVSFIVLQLWCQWPTLIYKLCWDCLVACDGPDFYWIYKTVFWACRKIWECPFLSRTIAGFRFDIYVIMLNKAFFVSLCYVLWFLMILCESSLVFVIFSDSLWVFVTLCNSLILCESLLFFGSLCDFCEFLWFFVVFVRLRVCRGSGGYLLGVCIGYRCVWISYDHGVAE